MFRFTASADLKLIFIPPNYIKIDTGFFLIVGIWTLYSTT